MIQFASAWIGYVMRLRVHSRKMGDGAVASTSFSIAPVTSCLPQTIVNMPPSLTSHVLPACLPALPFDHLLQVSISPAVSGSTASATVTFRYPDRLLEGFPPRPRLGFIFMLGPNTIKNAELGTWSGKEIRGGRLSDARRLMCDV
jgi:hypothetical protein